MICSDECYLSDSCFKPKYHQCALDGSYCKRLDRIDTLYNEALLTKEQRKVTKLMPESADVGAFTALNEIRNNIVDFVNNGRSLFLYSSTTGNGKTSWAIKYIQAYVKERWPYTSECSCLFINVPKFFMMLKDNISEKNDYIAHIKKYVNDVDLVVWDDIGTKMGSEYEIENLLSIINYRLDNNKSNVFTANLMPSQLEKCLGARLASRINGSEYKVELKGHDRRVVKGNA